MSSSFRVKNYFFAFAALFLCTSSFASSVSPWASPNPFAALEDLEADEVADFNSLQSATQNEVGEIFQQQLGQLAYKGSPEFEAVVRLLPPSLKSRSFAERHHHGGSWAHMPGANIAILGLVLTQLSPLVSASGDAEGDGGAWNLPIAVIFARESLEAVFIVASYYNLIQEALRSEDLEANEAAVEVVQPASKCFGTSGYMAELAKGTIFGVGSGLVVMAATGAILAGTKSAFSESYFELFEGISKIVAAVAIASVYHNVDKFVGRNFTDAERKAALENMSYSVFWNVFREMSEAIAFILPALLVNDLTAGSIASSSAAGLAIGLGSGGALLWARSHWNWDIKKFLKTVTYWFSVGMFMGGCHEIEEVAGETPTMLAFEPKWMDQNKFPMAILRVVGYTDNYTYVEAGAWGAVQIALHMHRQIAWALNQAKKPFSYAWVNASS